MKIGIALSGGGFRASLFHLGVLRRIAELGWLARVDAISGVSGGSIIAAFAALRWAEMLGAGGDADAFQKHIAVPFIEAVTDAELYSRLDDARRFTERRQSVRFDVLANRGIGRRSQREALRT